MLLNLNEITKHSSYKLAFQPFETLAYHLWSVYLFTKSDIKTIVIPMGLFAICNSPNSPLTRFAPSLFWVFIHLLEFDLANQTLDPAEDAQNKPYRPIPAGRISLEAACNLRWSLFAFTTLWSAYCSKEVLAASLFCNLIMYVYNDLGCLGNGQWSHRSIVLALAYLSFEIGACLSKGDNTILTPDTLLSITVCLGVFLTTSHCQDFKDILGDKLVGKHTFPIEYPTASRVVMFTINFWSALLTYVWQLSLPIAAFLNILGLVISLRFWRYRSEEADLATYKMYCIWFTTALCLPAARGLSTVLTH